MKINLLRQKILDLAIRGKLVPQDPNEEPASVLLERIRAEKERLIAEGKIKRPKKSKASSAPSHYQQFEPPFAIPNSWEWVRLEEIGEIVTGNTPPKDIQEYYGGDIPFFKPTDLEQGIQTVNSSDHLSDLGYRQSRQLPENTILITCIGATIGKAGLTKRAGTCNQQINAIIPFPQIDSEYIYFSCISGYFQSAIRENASATTLPIINKNNFSGIFLPLPPAEEQHRIIKQIYRLLEELTEIETSEEKLSATINIAKSKILDLAMQGKLVPQDPTDEPAINMLRRINPKAKIISDIPHYRQLPDNWVLTKLGDVVKVINGKSQKEVENPSGTYPIYGSGGIIGMADTYSCVSGSTIIGRKGTINNPLFIETNFWNVDTAFGMKPNEVVDDLYFYYFCISFDFTSLDKSSTLPSLTKSAIEKIVLPIPPLKEQHRIVSKIKEYDELFCNIIRQLGQK